jgi:catechol 2,3-dioxygenase-like lactoylglutathione lyase family enzyme
MGFVLFSRKDSGSLFGRNHEESTRTQNDSAFVKQSPESVGLDNATGALSPPSHPTISGALAGNAPHAFAAFFSGQTTRSGYTQLVVIKGVIMRSKVVRTVAISIATGIITFTNTVSAQTEAPVQAQHVRTMIVTCKIEETVKFYRDVLGMDVIRDDGGAPIQVAAQIIDMPETSLLRMAIFVGKGEYPAGPIIGSRIGMLGLMDPNDPACAAVDKPNHRTLHGGVIMPVRVSNTAEILKRAKAMGIEVIKEGPSPSRKTMQTLLYDPNGIVLELFELNVTPLP